MPRRCFAARSERTGCRARAVDAVVLRSHPTIDALVPFVSDTEPAVQFLILYTVQQLLFMLFQLGVGLALTFMSFRISRTLHRDLLKS